MDDGNGTPILQSQPKDDCKIFYGLQEKEKECYGKLIAVLIKIVRPNFQTSDDTVLTKLFDFILTQGKLSSKDREILIQILGEWLRRSIKHWSVLPEKSKVLALKIAGYVASSPAGYSKCASTGTLAFLLSRFQDTPLNSNADAQGFICFLESLISNNEGSRIILDSGVWKNIVNMALTSTSIYCVRQSTKLLADTLIAADTETSHNIFKEITQICARSPPNSPSEGNQNFPPTSQDLIISTLNACRTMILHLMEKGQPVGRIDDLVKSTDITKYSWELLKNEKRKRVVEAANRLLCAINSLLLYKFKDEKCSIPFESSNLIMDVILEHLHVLMKSFLLNEVADACVEYYILIQKFGVTVAPENHYDSQGKMITDVPFCIHNLLLLFQAFPMMMCLKVRDQHSMVDILNEYIDNLYKISNTNVLRLCYIYRDILQTYGEKVCILSVYVLRKFMHTCPIMRKEQAVIVFQGMVYVLTEFIVKPEESGDGGLTCRTFTVEGEEFIAKYPSFLSATLNCIHCYIKKFDFSWRDSLESLNLMSLLQKLLDAKSITRQITVETLKAIDIVLQKFMPPNLALLVDTIKDCSIQDFGAQLFRLLHHEDWAVRDSALEVVRTISYLSGSRFPAFQTLLLECKLPEVVVSMIDTDPEYFVRATSLSCLHELVKVRNIRQTLLEKNIVGKLLLILTNETEGIVRVGAAKCVTELHSRKILCSNNLGVVYDVMSHSARNDLHWEVKVECLEFWRSVLCISVHDQGMTDGSFPEFVYSKEQKKIIKLTPMEISQRLSKTLKMLGDIGCLHVLYDAFYNDPDLAVQKKASNLLKNVIYVIRRWKVNTYEESKNCRYSDYTPPDGETNLWDFPSWETMDLIFMNRASEDVIEQIVSQTDAELLRGMADVSIEVRKTLPHIERVVMSDIEFVRKMRNVNVDKVLEGREEWICDASQKTTSLLDDILLFMNEDATMKGSLDRNALDCY
ncbi:hypothetical protein GE061_016181 [Apolygus lucorum]|uniref:Uncharacterized protein n=1 Tax=Apolygus lucorum TaxID=248454 RepID=A0A8S9XFI1_APOLU|nr:hypothetical protein GE061_016181 [Apolygus lucorum]